MGRTESNVTLFARATPELAQALDDYCAARTKDEPERPMTRAEAIRVLLGRALAAENTPTKRVRR
jgi:hypothetical protein